MASLFGLLGVGRNGMRAHRYAIQVAAHNAANVATEGYTRRMVEINPITHTQPGAAPAPTGRDG
jgi:flagellar hook-associated protein FlgK